MKLIATLILIIFGAITFLPLFYGQLLVLIKPNDQKTKDFLIGKGDSWRDRTHFKLALAFGWADCLFLLPLFLGGSTGILLSSYWGYIIMLILGAICIYLSVVFWVLEKQYVYPRWGALAYFTYYWGFFLYWGIAAVVYSLVNLRHLII